MKKYSSKILSAVMLIVCLIVGGGIGFVLSDNISFVTDGVNYMVLLYLFYILLCLAISMILQIIIHELGHLVFGLMSGYKFCSFRIFNFMIKKEGEKLVKKTFSLAGTGGQCLMLPPNVEFDKMPTTLYNLGGVFMNLITAALSFILSIVFWNSILLPLWVMLCAVGVILAVSNGVPLNTGLVTNDGYHAYILKKSMAAKKCFWLQLKINQVTIIDNIRLKDMPQEWFEMPSKSDMDNSLCASVGYFIFCRYMDMMDFEGARKTAKEVKNNAAGLLGLHRALIDIDLIYIELVSENRREVIDGLMTAKTKEIIKKSMQNPVVLKTLYAYELLINANINRAKKHLQNLNKIAPSYPDEPELKLQYSLIEYADTVFRNRQIDGQEALR